MQRLIRITMFSLLGLATGTSIADEQHRIGEPWPALLPVEAQEIGALVCGNRHRQPDPASIQCAKCPLFTSDVGFAEIWTLRAAMRIHDAEEGIEQLLFDTDGCEPHFLEFGGALLMQKSVRAEDQPWTVQIYQPGYRLDDCLRLPGATTLLVCNEEFLAQGENFGDISAIRIGADRIDRWRLLHWYDNSGSDSRSVLRLVPTGARVIQDEGRPESLQVDLELLEDSRKRFDAEPDRAGEQLTVRFERAGDRLFPDTASSKVLIRLEKLMAKFHTD